MWVRAFQKSGSLYSAKEFFTSPVFDLYTDELNPKFQSAIKKRVHIMGHINGIWVNLAPNSTETFIFQKIKCKSPFSLHFFYFLKLSFALGLLQNNDSSKQDYLFTPKTFLVDLWTFTKKAPFLVILRILIQAVFHPELHTRINVRQKSLIIFWMTKPWNHIKFLLQNIILIVFYSFDYTIKNLLLEQTFSAHLSKCSQTASYAQVTSSKVYENINPEV